MFKIFIYISFKKFTIRKKYNIDSFHFRCKVYFLLAGLILKDIINQLQLKVGN